MQLSETLYFRGFQGIRLPSASLAKPVEFYWLFNQWTGAASESGSAVTAIAYLIDYCGNLVQAVAVAPEGCRVEASGESD